MVSLDSCVPDRSRDKYFRHLFLSLLDHPNDLRSVLCLYQALRGMDLSDTKSLITPLLGFSFEIGRHTPYHYRLKEDSKKKVSSTTSSSNNYAWVWFIPREG